MAFTLLTPCACQGFELQLSPQSGRSLAPNQVNGIQQSMEVYHTGDRNKKVESIKLRWRMSYQLGGELKSEVGDIAEFRLA